MRCLSLLAVSSILCSIASARSYAYDDPTVPSMPESSSKQPSRQKTQPSTPAPASAQPSTVTTQAGDNPPVKNGLPCIEEICIHDEPQDLDRINWKEERDAPRRRSFTDAINSGDDFYRRKVDNASLRAISKIQGACSALATVHGSYTNRNGDDVFVRFDSIVSPDGKRQKYIVARITRNIKGSNSLNNKQIEDLDSQTMQKYPAHYYNSYKSRKVDFSAGRVRFLPGGTGDASLQLSSPFEAIQFYKDKDGFTLSKFTNPQIFYNFPGCGSERKIKL